MDYFNYFTEIEEAFIQLSGKTLLSPAEWALIESWKDKGVPLELILQAIARAKEAQDKGSHQRINSLAYFANQIEASFTTWTNKQMTESADGRSVKA